MYQAQGQTWSHGQAEDFTEDGVSLGGQLLGPQAFSSLPGLGTEQCREDLGSN